MTVLITGASKGIGKALAYEFAKNGHNLVLTARSEDLLSLIKKDLESKYSIKVETFIFDLSDETQRNRFLNQVQNLDIEIVINNAGFGDASFFHKSDINKNLNMVDLNIKALMHLCHHFTQNFENKLKKNFKKNKYKILNVASIAAFAPGPGMATYFASKSFVLSFSNALHTELKDKGIHVATLCPGATRSDFVKRAEFSNQNAFDWGMSAESVAKISYKGLKKNTRVIVAGLQNKFMVAMMKLSPSGPMAYANKKLAEALNK